jgi:hypothetical protein
MLALRRRSRQVVVTNEKFNDPDMVGELLGKGQRAADQTGHALPQGIVETFDVIGSLNLSQFVARQIWGRNVGSLLCGRAHRLQRRGPL